MNEVFQLQVYRMQPNDALVILTVSPHIRGCLSHYKGQSVYCRGKDCPSALHACDPTWKGYIGVHVFNKASNKWRPFVLEVSENLELDMRGLYAPNQIWELYRLPGRKRHGGKVEGKLLEDRGKEAKLEAFDILPPIRTLYHAPDLVLTADNPLPARVIVQEVDLPAPDHVITKEDTQGLQTFNLQEALEKLNKAKKGKNPPGDPPKQAK